MSAVPPPPPLRAGPAFCPICQTVLAEGEQRRTCPDCGTEYHAECWSENRGCAVYGCPQVPPTEARKELEIPPSYWGQERKPCPVCGQEIMAAAVRCRNCGATFASARPETTEQFARRTATAGRLPEAARTVVVIFILCVVSCTAPVGAIVGLTWWPRHSEELKALPAVHGALLKIGIGVAIFQTGLLLVAAVLFAVFRSS